MEISYFLFDYIDRRVKSGDDMFKNTIDRGLQHLWYSYERLRNEVYPKILAADSIEDASFKRIEEAVFPVKAKIPAPGGLLFVDSRYKDIMSEASRHYEITHLCHYNPELPWVENYKIKEISLLKWGHDLWHITVASDAGTYLLQPLLDEVVSFLERLSPRCIILTYDNVQIDRLIALGARALNIPVITIQHGFFSSVGRPEILDGRASDLLLVWGEHIKNYYTAQRILPSSKVIVFGYPHKIHADHKNDIIQVSDNSPICFVGQNWESWNTDFGRRKERIISLFQEACSDLRIPYRYRPHHGEPQNLVERLIPLENIAPKGQTVDEAVATYSAFVSINSTMLLETAMRGKVSLQIQDAAYGFNDFQELGICYSCEDNIEALKESLNNIQIGKWQPFDVNPECIKVLEDPGGEFIKVLDELLSKWEQPQISKPIAKPRLLCVTGMDDQINLEISKQFGTRKGNLLELTSSHENNDAYSLISEYNDDVYGPSANVLDAFGDVRAKGLYIPTDLDIGKLNEFLSGNSCNIIYGDNHRELIVLFGRLTAFTLPYWQRRFADIQNILVITNPFETVQNTKPSRDSITYALAWIETMCTALANSTDIPLYFSFPDEPEAEKKQISQATITYTGMEIIPWVALQLYNYYLHIFKHFTLNNKSAEVVTPEILQGTASITQTCYKFALEHSRIISHYEKERLCEIIDILRHDLDAIQNSRSWRTLGFARRIGGLVKKLCRIKLI